MPTTQPKILFATSEAHPLIKTGGLADVSGALPVALKGLGVDIHILLPGYRQVLAACPDTTLVTRLNHPFEADQVEICATTLPGTAVSVFIVVYDKYFNRDGGPYQQPDGHDWPDNAQRFGLLSYVAAWLGSAANTTNWHPEIIHCNDWQTGLTPAYLHFWPGRKASTLMTVHNLAYQGIFSADTVPTLQLPAQSFQPQGLEYYGNLSFLKAGLFYADRLSTVSPTYAQEIQQEDLGFGMHGLLFERRDLLSGIINGIDINEWNPQQDSHLPHHYSAKRLGNKAKLKAELQQALGLHPEPHTPLVAIISRITYQKGSDMVLGVMHDLMREGVQFALLGSGDRAIEQAFVNLAHKLPGRIAVTIGYDEGLSHRMEAGADLFLMPSRYEPCGLNQMYSQRYGTPPIAHATGGLADTIVDATPDTLANGSATGFLFHEVNHHVCADTVRRAVRVYHDRETFKRMQQAGMACDFSWRHSAQEYLKLYRSLPKIHR